MSSDFHSLCQHRRSIRQYTSQAVERTKIEQILRCALMSPSSKRLNPWAFYVMDHTSLDERGEMKLRQLAGCKTYGSQMFATAMAAIVVAVDKQATDTWQMDGAIAAQNILLAAEDMGLGACWCQIYGREDSEEQVKALCQIKDPYSVLCAISLGYKAEERQTYNIDKLQYDKIHWI